MKLLNKIHFLGHFIFLTSFIIFLISIVLGCNSRDTKVSLFETPIDNSQIYLSDNYKFRYSSSANPVFNIKPLIDEKCVKCHNFEINKIPLTNYLEVYSRGILVKRAVQPGGKMNKYIPFDYEKIMTWYDIGMPE